MLAGHASYHDRSVVIDDDKLVSAAQKGNHEAFNQLVNRYQDRLYNLAVRITGNSDLADDIAQQTFLTAYLNLPRFRHGSFRSWLYRIATNACYDTFRQHSKYKVSSLENDDLSEERFSPIDDFSAASKLPEQELERRELAQVVQHALNQLEVDHRTVVILVDQQDLDYREAAQILGVPIGTVKSRLARARQRLHQLLSSTISVEGLAI